MQDINQGHGRFYIILAIGWILWIAILVGAFLWLVQDVRT